MIKSYISKKSLTEIDKIIQDYKIKVLKDIHSRYEIKEPLEEFLETFLKKKDLIFELIKNKKKQLNYDKCFAVIHNSSYGYYQCTRNKKEDCNFCAFHQKQCYYGNIIDNKNLIMDENSI